MTVRGDIIFPLHIAEGSRGGPRFKTTVNEVASGYEYRNIDWSKQRCEYDVSYGVKTREDAQAVIDLFYASRGRGYGFLFYDWTDHSIGTSTSPQALGTGTTFQLFKRYAYGSYYFDRTVTRPAAEGNGEQIRIDGTLLTGAQYTINAATGVLTTTVSGACTIYLPTFYVPVRFDQDNLPQELILPDFAQQQSIMLVEVKE